MMSRQEIYAWTSMFTTLALGIYYVVALFGWEYGLEAYTEQVASLAWKVIGLCVMVELLLGLARHFSIGDQELEARDVFIEARSYRNAYFVAMAGVTLLAVNVVLSTNLGVELMLQPISGLPLVTLHALLAVVFVASLTRAITQIVFYRGVLKTAEVDEVRV